MKIITASVDCEKSPLRPTNADADNQLTPHHSQHWYQKSLSKGIIMSESQETNSIRLLSQRTKTQEYVTFLKTFWNSGGGFQIIIIGALLGSGIGSLLAVVPQIFTQRFAEQYHGYSSDDPLCMDLHSTKPEACIQGGRDAQNAAAYTAMGSHLMALIFNSIAGTYSDIYGRRCIQIASATLLTISPAALIIVHTFQHISPAWFYALDSISNGVFSVMSVAYSILSDIISENNRVASFGLYVGAFMGGLTIGSYSVTTLNHFHAAGLSLAFRASALFVAIFFLPETLPPNVAQMNQHRNELCIGGPLKIICMPFRELSILVQSRLLILVSIASFLGKMVFRASATLIYYYLENNLEFEQKDIALWLLMGGLLNITVQAVLLKPLSSLMGERVLLVISFCCGAAENIMIAAARSKMVIFISTCVGGLKFVDDPLLSSLASRSVDEAHQGKILGSLAALGALAEAAGPPAMNFIYRHSNVFGMGTMFVAAAGLQLLAAFVSIMMPLRRIGETSLLIPSDDAHESETDGSVRTSEPQMA